MNGKPKKEEIETYLKSLGEKIKEELKKLPNNKYEENGFKATITNKTTYKYTDESAIVNYIIQKGLSDIYLSKEISTTKLNNALKEKGQLYENLKSYVSENITEALTVSGGKN